MGFIKKLLGNLLAFLGGFFGSLSKLLGFNKSGYFLELDESKDDQSNSATPMKFANAPAAIPLSSSASNGASPKSEPVKPESVKPEPVKVQSKTRSANAAPAAAQTSSVDQNDDSVPASKPTVALSTPQPVPTFAPNFLMSTASQNGRRRPGPSMSYFLDMAKKVKA